MNRLEITAEQRAELASLFAEYQYPDPSYPIEKVQTIALLWFVELAKCRTGYSKKLNRHISLTTKEKELLKTAFKKAFDVDLEFLAQGTLERFFGCLYGKKRGIKLLPKNQDPLTTYNVKASWQPNNPHIKFIPPLTASLADLLARERLLTKMNPDTVIEIGEQGLLSHSFLLQAHAQNISLQPRLPTPIKIEGVDIEIFRLVQITFYTGTLPLDENSDIKTIIEYAKAAKKIGAQACLKAAETLLCKKAETHFEEVKALADELELSELQQQCKEVKQIQTLPPLPFGADAYIIDE